jgi:hypothetical protein
VVKKGENKKMVIDGEKQIIKSVVIGDLTIELIESISPIIANAI